jgi:hypothetical protein
VVILLPDLRGNGKERGGPKWNFRHMILSRESCVKVLGRVHLIVFMNKCPDMYKLSVDRYRVLEITENGMELSDHRIFWPPMVEESLYDGIPNVVDVDGSNTRNMSLTLNMMVKEEYRTDDDSGYEYEEDEGEEDGEVDGLTTTQRLERDEEADAGNVQKLDPLERFRVRLE